MDQQKTTKQMLEFAPKLTRPEHGNLGILNQFTHLNSLSQENIYGAEKKQDLFAHSPLPMNQNYFMNLT